jgi:hypothetical protein
VGESNVLDLLEDCRDKVGLKQRFRPPEKADSHHSVDGRPYAFEYRRPRRRSSQASGCWSGLRLLSFGVAAEHTPLRASLEKDIGANTWAHPWLQTFQGIDASLHHVSSSVFVEHLRIHLASSLDDFVDPDRRCTPWRASFEP